MNISNMVARTRVATRTAIESGLARLYWAFGFLLIACKYHGATAFVMPGLVSEKLAAAVATLRVNFVLSGGHFDDGRQKAGQHQLNPNGDRHQ
jgi:hypothetical protein